MNVGAIKINYTPQPKQMLLHLSAANEILYGGAAGPGKSHALRFEALKWALLIPGLQVYLFRRTNPELERNHVIPCQQQFPKEIGKYKGHHKRYELMNGSMIHMCHCQYQKDVFNYQGAEIHLLVIDELTTFTSFIYDYLRGRLRCTLDVPQEFKHKIPGIVCGTNPGGVGHAFAKKRWVDFAEPMELKRAPKKEGGMVRQYIPGKIEDNPILMKEDPEYIHRLDALPEPYRTAYLDGNWDLFMGQMFAFNTMDHVIDPLPVPEQALVVVTFDWGFGAPYSVGWWWIDGEGRKYRFAELYGHQPGMVNVGLRQTDDEIAEAIKGHEAKQELAPNQRIIRLCDPTSFNKKPNYLGGGQGESTANVFARHGLLLHPCDPSRILKIRQFHAHLRVKRDEQKRPLEPPMMLIYRTCENFIRTIPLLQADLNNIEDVDTKMEDHQYDEAAQVVMYQPVSGMEAVGAGIPLATCAVDKPLY